MYISIQSSTDILETLLPKLRTHISMKINKGVALLSGLPDVQHDLGLVALRAATACCASLLKRACERTRTDDVQVHRQQAQSPGWGAASTGANSQPSSKLSGSVPTRGFHVRVPMSTQAAPIPTLHADRLSAPSWQCSLTRATPPRSHIDPQGLVEVCASRGLDCPAWRFRASALDAIIICIASVLTKCLREFATWSQGSSWRCRCAARLFLNFSPLVTSSLHHAHTTSSDM
mmetsp:Transcript_76587/g.215401  ORF Transcript_76587/g.215401 Transcript_76587/m.215401 type:complete len:232 (-) Transcript_76587:1062-1757(-)